MAHEVLVMKDGEVLESGTVDEVLERRATPTRRPGAAAA
jgi:ABC-type microcin C transport system duplicated ATPase subunit YejF